MGKLFKGLFKFTIAAAAVGGVAYAFRDQIKESQVYKDYDVDGKIKKVKSTIMEKMPKTADSDDDFDDLDDIEDDITGEDAGYVSLDPETSSSLKDFVKDAANNIKNAAEEAASKVEEAAPDTVPIIES